MKIGINLTDLVKGEIGGMESYMRSLVYYLPAISKKDAFYVVGYEDVIKTTNLNGCIPVFIHKTKDRVKLSISLTNIISLYKLDAWISPLLFLDPPKCPVPCVVTVPDMQHEYFPNFFDEATLKWRKQKYQDSVTASDVVFTLSKASRRDIIRYLDVSPDKVKYFHIDSPVWFADTKPRINATIVKQKYALPERYIFYPANTWPHKNHLRLLKAFDRIKDVFPDLTLVLTGYPHHADEKVRSFIKTAELTRRVMFLGYIDTNDIIGIYNNALALIFPSLFEGFGIPIIEAFRSGCPVTCSNNTSLPEIAGDAALYFDALSVSSIQDAIVKIVSNHELRTELVNKGWKRAHHFSYERTVDKMLNTIRGIKPPNKAVEISMQVWPKISVVTPSFNQGKYIERTILSVLGQNYPNLEYIIVDGGSKDNTVKILEKYTNKLKWISEPDNGQTHAINKGIKMSSGEIVAYLNSDDVYEPKTLKDIALFFHNNPQAHFVYGEGIHIDENDGYIEEYPSQLTDFWGLLPQCHICQPTAFWKRDIIDKIGYFDESLTYCMDYDYWVRIAPHFKLNFLQKHLGSTRLYPQTKTLGQKNKVYREIIEVQMKHYHVTHINWIFSLLHAKLEKYDRKTLIGNTIFIMGLIFGSLYGSIKFNKALPPKYVFKYYLIWIKELIIFVLKKKFISIQ